MVDDPDIPLADLGALEVKTRDLVAEHGLGHLAGRIDPVPTALPAR